MPSGTKSKYKATSGWNKFANIVDRYLTPVDGGETVRLTVGQSTGFWTAANPANIWASKWESTQENPHIIIRQAKNANNMNFWDGENIKFFNSVGGSTDAEIYEITVSSGWNITAVSLDFKCDNDKGVSVALDDGDAVECWSTEDFEHVEITNLKKEQVNMTVATLTPGYTTFADTKNFVITLSKQATAGEETDIATISNVIYIEPIEEFCGTEAAILLKMKNTAAIRGFQFDLYLPEGVTVVKSSKGKIQGFLSEGRLPDEDEHTLTFSEQPDGAIRFLCSSQYDETFTGNDGEIATLRVNIAEDMTDGDYPLLLKNIKLTETDISRYYETPLVKCKLTVKTYTPGDINGDGAIDVSDYTGVANHIHGNTPEGFVVKAADVDKSGTIDVSDYTGIANIIHTGSIYGNSSSGAPVIKAPRRVNTDLSAFDNVIYITPFAVKRGEQIDLSIKMKNTAEIRGFQFDLYLPEGMSVVKSGKGRIQGSLNSARLPEDDEHDLTFSEQADGAIRFLCSSQYEETFTGNDGEIAILKVNVASDMAHGAHHVIMKAMKLTENNISNFYTADYIETTVTVHNTTGIKSVNTNTNDNRYYTLDGRTYEGTPTKKGVYIVDGHTVIVK